MTTWKLTAKEQPPLSTIVLIATREGYVFTSKLSEHNGKLRWNCISGHWPLERVAAWMSIPKVDVKL